MFRLCRDWKAWLISNENFEYFLTKITRVTIDFVLVRHLSLQLSFFENHLVRVITVDVSAIDPREREWGCRNLELQTFFYYMVDVNAHFVLNREFKDDDWSASPQEADKRANDRRSQLFLPRCYTSILQCINCLFAFALQSN